MMVMASLTAVSQTDPAVFRLSKASNISGIYACFAELIPGAFANETDVTRAQMAVKRCRLRSATNPTRTKIVESGLRSSSIFSEAPCWGEALRSPGNCCSRVGGEIGRGCEEIGERVTEEESKLDEMRSYLNRSAKSSLVDIKTLGMVDVQRRNAFHARRSVHRKNMIILT